MTKLWTLTHSQAKENNLSGRYAHILSIEEQAQLNDFKSAKRTDQFLFGRILMRLVLSKHLECHPEEIKLHQTKNKKPILEPHHNFSFSLSHSGEQLALAVAEGAPLGLDIECVKNENRALKISQQFFSTQERQWLEMNPEDALLFWVAKESIVKALGLSVWDGLQDIQLEMVAGEIKVKNIPNNLPSNNWNIHCGNIDKTTIFSLAQQSNLPLAKVYQEKFSLY